MVQPSNCDQSDKGNFHLEPPDKQLSCFPISTEFLSRPIPSLFPSHLNPHAYPNSFPSPCPASPAAQPPFACSGEAASSWGPGGRHLLPPGSRCRQPTPCLGLGWAGRNHTWAGVGVGVWVGGGGQWGVGVGCWGVPMKGQVEMSCGCGWWLESECEGRGMTLSQFI